MARRGFDWARRLENALAVTCAGRLPWGSHPVRSRSASTHSASSIASSTGTDSRGNSS